MRRDVTCILGNACSGTSSPVFSCGVIRVENPFTNRMFARFVQPDVVSLFSSTGSDPLGLFSVQVDGSLPSDSFIHLLNDSTSLPAPPPPAVLITAPSVYRDQHTDTSQGHQLHQNVLHIQSPTLRKTFIQCPPFGSAARVFRRWGARTETHLGAHPSPQLGQRLVVRSRHRRQDGPTRNRPMLYFSGTHLFIVPELVVIALARQSLMADDYRNRQGSCVIAAHFRCSISRLHFRRPHRARLPHGRPSRSTLRNSYPNSLR